MARDTLKVVTFVKTSENPLSVVKGLEVTTRRWLTRMKYFYHFSIFLNYLLIISFAIPSGVIDLL